MLKNNVKLGRKYVTKQNVSAHENLMQSHAVNILGEQTPNITSYNPITKILKMERIKGKTIFDLYGDDILLLPENLFSQIKDLINKLYANDILYRDITPFNFIFNEEINQVSIIDFEHAVFIRKSRNGKNLASGYSDDHKFVRNFIKRKKFSWNENFK
jgi:tRNA A-37 threonylcarbamoyl transferase component Bud32